MSRMVLNFVPGLAANPEKVLHAVDTYTPFVPDRNVPSKEVESHETTRFSCMCGSLESTEETSSVSVDRSRVKVKNTLSIMNRSYVATNPDSMIASCFMNVRSERGLESGLDNPLLSLLVNAITEGLDPNFLQSLRDTERLAHGD